MRRLMRFRRLTSPKPAGGLWGPGASEAVRCRARAARGRPSAVYSAFSWLDEAPHRQWGAIAGTGSLREVGSGRAEPRRPRPVRVGGPFAHCVRMWRRSEWHRRPRQQPGLLCGVHSLLRRFYWERERNARWARRSGRAECL